MLASVATKEKLILNPDEKHQVYLVLFYADMYNIANYELPKLRKNSHLI